MKTYLKSDPKMEPKSIKNHSKIDAKKGTKKRGSNRWPARCGQSPNPIISKDILRSEVRRKHTKKVEWRVSAEWSAKSGVQKESAERQVQTECKRQVQKGKCRQVTHYAPKHARWPATTCGSMGYRLFRRPRFYLLLCLCVWGSGIVGLWDCVFVGLWVCGCVG